MTWGTPAQSPHAPTMTVEERNNLIKSWLGTKAEFAVIRDREMSQRKDVTAALFPNPVKGTQRFELGDGYKVKLVHGYNYTLGNKDLTDNAGAKVPVNVQVEEAMDAIEKLGNEGAFLVDRIVKTKYELSITEYQQLDETNPTQKAIKDIIDKLLIVTEASPTLEFEEPKAK